ncbi:MAG TPA: S53 family peptidase [Streptosporangiaceae bacterium]|nr:S53 family peptidase [Streptosporangiaceae bacterium]
MPIALAAASLVVPLAALAGPAAAATSTPAPGTPEQVPMGIDVGALPGAQQVFPGVSGGTEETVSFILKEQNVSSLESQVESGVRNYLSVGQFASTYGQPESNISALTSYLAGFGITSTVYADHVDVSTTGTAQDYDNALSVTEKEYSVPAFGSIPARDWYGVSQAPLLPYRLANFVEAILGLSNYPPFADSLQHVNSSYLAPQGTSDLAPGDGAYCVALTGLSNACNLPSNFASNYDLTGLYDRGAKGQGTTLAIVTLAAVDPGAPEYFWANIAHVTRSPVDVVNIDGGPGAPSNNAGTGETDLDLEQSGALAPGANVIDYQAPNTDPGFADAFFTAASQNTADTVSSSWGESETILKYFILAGEETTAYAAAFDEAFLELDVQGQSTFIASGDTGAYAAFRDLGSTNLSVGSNADSPYVTAAGGTTLPWTGTLSDPSTGKSATVTVSSQRIWGWDYLWAPIASITGEPESEVAFSNIGGGTGGFSTIEPTPSYQESIGAGRFDAVQYLTPTDYTTVEPGLTVPLSWSFNPTPNVSEGFNIGRMVPDVSADADPYSGYLLYEPSFTQAGQPILQGGWGGTSFVAPQLNGSTAVIDSYLGHRVGLWNPTIYPAAAGGDSPFSPMSTDSTSNDNLYYTGEPGSDYNPGAGLGYPNLTELASFFR